MIPVQREVLRVGAFLLVSFAVVGLSAAYWSVSGPTSLLLRNDNARQLIAARSVARGALLDRTGAPLAVSVQTEGGMARTYTPVVDPAILGTVVNGTGVSGAEAVWDPILRGESQDSVETAIQNLMHQPQAGNDVRLSLSLEVQQALVDGFGDSTGAAVVISMTDGEILGMISRPADPAADATPEPGESTSPENVAINGQYPVGGALLPAWLSAALLEGTDITQAVFPAGACAANVPESLAISLQESFLYGCPDPFQAMASGMSRDAVNATLSRFIVSPPQDTLAGILDAVPVASGAAERTASALAVALMSAAIADDGAAPSPVIGLDWQPPGDAEPTSLVTERPPIPVTTATTARRLQDIMRQAVAEGAAQNAGRARLDIGGLAALAGSEVSPVAWFTGFTSLPNRQGAAVAIVLDGTTDTGLAADIGGAALEAAASALQGDR